MKAKVLKNGLRRKNIKVNFLFLLLIVSIILNILSFIIYRLQLRDQNDFYLKNIYKKDSVIYQRDSSISVWMNSFERVKKIFKEDTAKINWSYLRKK